MRLAFYAMLGLSIVVDVVLGAWAGTAWKSFVSFWFTDVEAMLDPGTKLVGFVLALALFFFAALQILAFRWIRARDDDTGYSIVIAFSTYLLVSGIATFAVFRGAPIRLGGLEFLLLDGARGVLLGALALLARNAPATVTKLRLPKKRVEERSHRSAARGGRPSHHASRDSSEQRRRGRRGSGRARSQERADRGKSPRRRSATTESRTGEDGLSVVVRKDRENRPESSRRRTGRGRQTG